MIYILNRKTLEVLGEFVIGAAQANPPGHQIAADQRGNLYAPQAAQTGSDGKGRRLDCSEVRVQGVLTWSPDFRFQFLDSRSIYFS